MKSASPASSAALAVPAAPSSSAATAVPAAPTSSAETAAPASVDSDPGAAPVLAGSSASSVSLCPPSVDAESSLLGRAQGGSAGSPASFSAAVGSLFAGLRWEMREGLGPFLVEATESSVEGDPAMGRVGVKSGGKLGADQLLDEMFQRSKAAVPDPIGSAVSSLDTMPHSSKTPLFRGWVSMRDGEAPSQDMECEMMEQSKVKRITVVSHVLAGHKRKGDGEVAMMGSMVEKEIGLRMYQKRARTGVDNHFKKGEKRGIENEWQHCWVRHLTSFL